METFFADPWYSYTPRSQYYSLKNRQVSAHPPNVVSIPVHNAAPEHGRSDPRSDAAVKIQKVFRGYLVRKSFSKIAGINRKVEEILERVLKKETADLLRKDAKERLRVVETLMSLLLKMDAVKGVDYGVRDLRRSVIKKVIALQEKVEACGARHHQT